MTLDQRITAFALDPEMQAEALALLAVGRDKGDSPEEIIAHVIASVLLRFHRIPIQGGLN